MPNYCYNILEINHSDPNQIKKVFESFIKNEFLNSFIPIPNDLNIPAGNIGMPDSPKQIAHENKQKNNKKIYGYSDWYEFCMEEWGVKWDVGCTNENITQINDNTLIINFQSAYRPPVPAYHRLAKLGFKINATFYEPGAGFVGWWIDGEEYYELPVNLFTEKILPNLLKLFNSKI